MFFSSASLSVATNLFHVIFHLILIGIQNTLKSLLVSKNFFNLGTLPSSFITFQRNIF